MPGRPRRGRLPTPRRHGPSPGVCTTRCPSREYGGLLAAQLRHPAPATGGHSTTRQRGASRRASLGTASGGRLTPLRPPSWSRPPWPEHTIRRRPPRRSAKARVSEPVHDAVRGPRPRNEIRSKTPVQPVDRRGEGAGGLTQITMPIPGPCPGEHQAAVVRPAHCRRPRHRDHGAARARNLARAGHTVRAWNRTRDKAGPLAADGVEITGAPAEAVTGADVVLTMLYDGSRRPGCHGADRRSPASRHGLGAVDRRRHRGGRSPGRIRPRTPAGLLRRPAPGTRQPAEAGQLAVPAAGPSEHRHAVAPVLDAAGEVLALPKALGVDPQSFFDTIAGGGLGMPYLRAKAGFVLNETGCPRRGPPWPPPPRTPACTVGLERGHGLAGSPEGQQLGVDR